MELPAADYGKNELVAVMLLVWAADTGAYLFGRRWGQHKMIPLVSPGKSWEGLFGGILSVFIVGSIEILWMNPFSLMGWYAVILITALVSVVGDLWISMLKRRSNIKDSGHVIPGHGGLLDRMDSLLAALPVFYCCLNFLNNN
jgi:phosphatidate cytidylyltransferase